MNVCETHGVSIVIVYDNGTCPMCRLEDDLSDANTNIEDKDKLIKELQDQVNSLENE